MLEYYRQRVDEAAARISLGNPLNVAIVAALNVVDELLRTRSRDDATTGGEQHASTLGADGGAARLAVLEAEQIASRLIDQLDRALATPEDGRTAATGGESASE